jgi:hypothetical protein
MFQLLAAHSSNGWKAAFCPASRPSKPDMASLEPGEGLAAAAGRLQLWQ